MNKQITLPHFLKYIGFSFLLFVTLDLVSRAYFHFEDKKIESIIKFDSQLGWDFQGSRDLPFPLSFNDLGIRENKTSAELKNEVNNIVFLGNSVVMAQHVAYNETFVKKIQNQLQGYYCINTGLDGFELHREIIKFKRDLTHLKNIKSLIWFPNRNDFKTKEDIDSVVEQTRKLQQLESKKIIKDIVKDMIKGNFFVRSSASFQNFASEYLQPTSTGTVTYTQKDFGYTSGLTDLPSKASLSLMEDDVQILKKILEDQDIQFLAVFIPSKHYSSKFGWNEAKAFHQIASILDKYKIRHHQLLDSFHSQTNPASLFIDYVHLNEKGHQFVAEEVLKLKILTPDGNSKQIPHGQEVTRSR